MMSADLREFSEAVGQRDRKQPEAPLDPRRRLLLLQECRDLVVARLSAFITEALDQIGVELAGSAVKAVSHEEQQALFDALTLVRSRRHDIEFRFRKIVAELFEQRLFEPAASARTSTNLDGELALLDDSAIDDRIALDRLARNSRRQLDPDEVLGVRARLATLLDREWFDEDDYPASPELVFQALQDSLDEMTTSPSARTALLQAFEPWVTSSLADMHVSLNEHLLGKNVLTSIRLRPVRRQDPASAGMPGMSSMPFAAGADPEGGFRTSLSGPAMAGSGIRDGHPHGLPSAGAPADPSRLFEDLVHRIHADQGDQAGVRRMAAGVLSDPGTFAATAAPMPAAATTLIEALHALQSSSREASDVAPLIAQAIDHAREQGSPLDRLTVDIVSLVFDYIYADRRLPDPVKQQLLRLQVVAVKAALLDRSFFARRQHPMRRLIDRISLLATDPDVDSSGGATLIGGITSIVDWILEDFDDDLTIFDEALERFDGLAQAEEERRAAALAELAAQAELTEALVIAREAANADLAACIDATTPVFLRVFLDDWWSAVLARAQVDGSCAGMDWPAALRVAQTLVWSVAPKAPDEVVRLAACLPQMITSLIEALQETGMDETQRRQFFDQLLQWHAQVIRDAKKGYPDSPAARFRPDAAGQGTAAGPLSASSGGAGAGAVHAAMPMVPAAPVFGFADVDALHRGDLIEFDDDDGVVQRARLAWISPGRRLYILSRFPDFGRSLERAELISWIASGRARRIKPHSAVDSALDAIAAADDDAIS